MPKMYFYVECRINPAQVILKSFTSKNERDAFIKAHPGFTAISIDEMKRRGYFLPVK